MPCADCAHFFVVDKTQQLTACGDTSLHLLALKSSMDKNKQLCRYYASNNWYLRTAGSDWAVFRRLVDFLKPFDFYLLARFFTKVFFTTFGLLFSSFGRFLSETIWSHCLRVKLDAVDRNILFSKHLATTNTDEEEAWLIVCTSCTVGSIAI